MEINGPWAMGEYTGKVRFRRGPGAGRRQRQAGDPASTVPMVVSAKSKHKAAAIDLLRLVDEQDRTGGPRQGFGLPAVGYDMAGDAALASNPFVPKFAAQAAYARLYLPDSRQFTQIDTDDLLDRDRQGERGADVTSVLKTASSEINQLTGCKS